MPNGPVPYLCGGTFLALISEARSHVSSAKERLSGKSGGSSEPSLLRELLFIYHLKPVSIPLNSSLKYYTSTYKKCMNSHAVRFQFTDSTYRKAFDDDVRSGGATTQQMMDAYVERFIDKEENGELLVSSLLDVIEHDDEISPNDVFYISADGNPTTKAELSSQDEFSLAPFLLGVWHYIVMNRAQSNKKGAATYSRWFQEDDHVGSRKYVYVGTVGTGASGFTRTIKIVPPNAQSTPSATAISAQSDTAGETPSIPEIITQPAVQPYSGGVDLSTLSLQAKSLLDENLNRKCYSLFVSNEIDIVSQEPFTIPRNRTFTVTSDPSLAKTYASLSDEDIEALKSFPCIFANENREFGRTDGTQLAGIGYAKYIQANSSFVEIYPKILYYVPQQRLNESIYDLALWKQGKLNDFNTTQWIVKKADLLGELIALGLLK